MPRGTQLAQGKLGLVHSLLSEPHALSTPSFYLSHRKPKLQGLRVLGIFPLGGLSRNGKGSQTFRVLGSWTAEHKIGVSTNPVVSQPIPHAPDQISPVMKFQVKQVVADIKASRKNFRKNSMRLRKIQFIPFNISENWESCLDQSCSWRHV